MKILPVGSRRMDVLITSLWGQTSPCWPVSEFHSSPVRWELPFIPISRMRKPGHREMSLLPRTT